MIFEGALSPDAQDRFSARRLGSGTGFTIVEVLVVVGVIGVLLGLLLPALSSARSAGRQTIELSAARQLMAAYINYATVNNDAVLPGYADWIPNTAYAPGAKLLNARDARGKLIQGGQLDTARKRYIWRLAPYLNYNLRGLYVNQQQDVLEDLERKSYTDYLYAASVAPSLGLNTDWMGGSSAAYGFLAPNDPLRNALDLNRYYVTSLSQVLHPKRLLVFASARGTDPELGGAAVVEGYFQVKSPYFTELTGYQWSPEFQVSELPPKYGYISPRHEGRAVIGFADGHADTLLAAQLKDMRYWANWADSEDWRLPLLNGQ
jgi:prepilin-type processing-associated H-X9-DG protein